MQLIPELAHGDWLNAILQSIQGYLSSQDSLLASFNLPMPTLRPSELDDELAAFCSSAAKMREFVRKTRTQFNAEQAQVYAKLEAVVVQGKGKTSVGVSAA